MTIDAQIYEELQSVSHEFLGTRSIVLTPDMKVAEFPNWSPSMLMALVMSVENYFKVTVRLSEADGLRTVEDIVAVVRRKLDQSAPANNP